MGSVTVCGSASTTVTPDRVIVSFGLTHVAAEAGAAVEEIAQRSNALAALLASAGFERTDWTTEGVRVNEEWEYRENSNVRVGYRADAGVAVVVRDLDAVGRLISSAIADADAAVRSLDWKVDADNPSRRLLLGEAARDAKVRATAYVEALGLQLGAVEAISEEPFAAAPSPGPMPMMMRSAKADAAPMDVSGGLVPLTADVHIRFTLI
jgi:uncharacterized protein YggE